MDDSFKGPGPGAAPYMPFMIELNNVLVFGGEKGEGLQKTEKLSLYARNVTVIPGGPIPDNAPVWDMSFVFSRGPVRYVAEDLAFPQEKSAEILPVSVKALFEPFIHQGEKKSQWWFGLKSARRQLRQLLQDRDYVVSDLPHPAYNEILHQECKRLGIRHTVIDNKEYSDTWFMSLVDAGPILAGISTRGNCAFYSRQLRQELEQDFRRRAPLARTLTRLRDELPRKGRHQGLQDAYASSRFIELVKTGREQEALELAHSIIDENKER